MDLLVLLFRLAGDSLALILLYDFFVQPFRFYGMDPLTRFVYVASRWACAPFEAFSRRIIQVPDRDLAPLFTLVVVMFTRGLLYAGAAALNRPDPLVIVLGLTLSFLELFTRIMIPGLLFILYADIQLAHHQSTFVGNVTVMLVHDIAKRFILMIRKILWSYKPMTVFAAVFLYLALFQWLLLVITLLPFQQSAALHAFPFVLQPEGVARLTTPFILLPVVLIRLANTFLTGIFILILLQMIAGFSGLDPYDRTSLILGLVIAPWVNLARRLFPFARMGMIDFSIAILLFILYSVLALMGHFVARLG
jgi:hypothetical protein